MRRLGIPNVVFFCAIGLVADTMNFMAAQSEIFVASAQYSANELQLGILGAVSSLGYLLPAFAMGMISERTGRRPLCMVACAGLTVCYLATLKVQTVEQLWAISFVRSAFTACLWPPLMAWMAELEHHQRLSRLLGWYNISWSGGILCGFYLAGLLFTFAGWKSGFYVPAVLGVGMFLFVTLCTPAGGNIPAGVELEPDAVKANPAQVNHFVRQGLILMGVGTLVSAVVMYLFPKVDASIDEQRQSLLNTVRMAGVLSAFLVLGRSHAWHYRRWPMWVCLAGLVLGTCLVAWSHHYALYLAGFAMIGFGFGVAFTMSSFYALGLMETKGKGSGMMETLIGGGGLVGPLFGGAVGSVTTARTGILSALIPVAVFGWMAARRRKSLP